MDQEVPGSRPGGGTISRPPGLQMTNQLVLERDGAWGVITLNNPKAFNSLTVEMVDGMQDALEDWAADDAVKGVLLKSDHEKAFCAGGDIRWLHDNALVHPMQAAQFFRDEYRLNSFIFHYPKPFVSLVNGINMGGGVGISMPGSHMVVTEKTKWAMPETAIGMVPDVGGTYHLGQLEEGLGSYLGLTGVRLDGADCLYAGIAKHLVPAERMADVEQALRGMVAADVSKNGIDQLLAGFEEKGESTLSKDRTEIDRYFSSDKTVEEIIGSLEAAGSEFAEKTLKLLAKMSPTLLKVTQEAVRRGRTASFDDCLVTEFGITARLMEGPDFLEGVRALIIDKDQSPNWAPSTVPEVGEALVSRYFETLGDQALELPGYARRSG